MYAAVGAGDLSSSTVVNAAQDLVGDRPQPKLRVATPPGRRRGRGGKVEVQGVGNLLTHMAGCCKPLPGDRIVGYITQGRGVSVHRADCQRVMQFQEEAPQRIIDVDWGAAEGERFEVDLAIEAYDRQGLLRDVTALFANARINVLAINTLSNKNTHTATMQLTVEISDLGSLAKLLERLNRLKNVISAARLDR
jgi:GTP pyrophosphokinase